MSGPEAAKDLTVKVPRGLYAELEGYAWLPRMLDKGRATLAGTAGGYPFGCPLTTRAWPGLGSHPRSCFT